MKHFLVVLGLVFGVCNAAYGEDRIGLHNSTKEFTPENEMLLSDWTNPEEIERVWQSALVRVPSGQGGFVKSTVKDLDQVPIGDGAKYPAIIYLHGCSGVWDGTIRRINFLASSGFAVFAPISLARHKYPKSCDVASHKGGLYRQTLLMRQIDAKNAIRKAKALPWVDPENIFLGAVLDN